MKIGILTFHRAENFGAVLQAYALQSFLLQEGYDVRIIDYRNAAIERSYHISIPLSCGAEKISLSLYRPICCVSCIYKKSNFASGNMKTFAGNIYV